MIIGLKLNSTIDFGFAKIEISIPIFITGATDLTIQNSVFK